MIVPGNHGYAEIADEFIERTEALTFDQVHRHTLHLYPDPPARVLDIGAASGRDAAALAARGYQVTAVEPTDVLRNAGRKRHADAPIEWMDDALPHLESLAGREGTFDLALATAVWMHLDAQERRDSLRRIAELLIDGGRFAVSLRHGPFPDNRRRFEVTASETLALAGAEGLVCLFEGETPSTQEGNRKLGVVWTLLVFEKALGG